MHTANDNLDTDHSWTIHKTKPNTVGKTTLTYRTKKLSAPLVSSTLMFSVDANSQQLHEFLLRGHKPKINYLDNLRDEKYFEALNYLTYSKEFGYQKISLSLKDPDSLTALNVYFSTLCEHKIISPGMLRSIPASVLEITSDQLDEFNTARFERIQDLYLKGDFSQALDLAIKYEKLTQDAFTDKLIDVCFDRGNLEHFIAFCHFIVSSQEAALKEASDFKKLFFKLAEKFFVSLDSLNLDSIIKREYLKLTLRVLDTALPNDYADRLKKNIFYILSGEKMDSKSEAISNLTTLTVNSLISVADALLEKNTQLENLKETNRSLSEFSTAVPIFTATKGREEIQQEASSTLKL